MTLVEGLLYAKHFFKVFLHILTNVGLRIPLYSGHYYQLLLRNKENLNNLPQDAQVGWSGPGV